MDPDDHEQTEGQDATGKSRPTNQATRLVELALESVAVLYVDAAGRPCVDVQGDGDKVVWLGGHPSRQWLIGLLFEAEGLTASQGAVRQAMLTLEDIARRKGSPIPQEILDRMKANVAIARETGGDGERKRSQAEQLVDLALEQGIELFHDERGEPWAVLPLARGEIWAVGSKAVKRWLARLLWQEHEKAPSGETLATAVNLLSSMAVFDGLECTLHLRVAWHEAALWYDLGDWRAVKITPQGWEVVEQPPVLFRHFAHQLVQAEPQPGGDFRKLFDFIAPARSEDDTVLLGVTTLADLVPGSPRPAISIGGAQGSGKSTTAKMIKRTVDPSKAKSIRRIADFRELQLQLEQNWLLNIDNVTNLPTEISDALAAAITGDSDLRRVLYTDQDLLLLDYMRPMVLNGITHAAQRPDLLDRTVLITLERIPEDLRREEEELWPEFAAALPTILGGAFDILSKAMAIRPSLKLSARPRMADYGTWGYAIAEAAGWGGSVFLAAYQRNIQRQHEEAVAASVVVQVLLAFMDNQDQWQGPASSLKPKLDAVAELQGVDVKDRRSGWPQDAARLSKELRRLAETLAASGVVVSFPARGSKRSIRLRMLVKTTVGTVGTVGTDTEDTDGEAAGADGREANTDGSQWRNQSYADGTDGTDGKNQGFSEVAEHIGTSAVEEERGQWGSV
jgi:hypothetical protein